MHYEAIHACLDDHVIYYNHHEFAIECPKCHVSRYRTNKVTKKVPQKVLRYIPIIPCLQRLFGCNNIAQFMDYHARNRISLYSLYIIIIDIDIPYLYIVGLQTKGKFACPVCGPKIKSHRSKLA